MITRSSKIGATVLMACLLALGMWQIVFLRPGTEMSEVQALRLKILRLEERSTAIHINSKLLEAQAKEFLTYNVSMQKAIQAASEEAAVARAAQKVAEEALEDIEEEMRAAEGAKEEGKRKIIVDGETLRPLEIVTEAEADEIDKQIQRLYEDESDRERYNEYERRVKADREKAQQEKAKATGGPQEGEDPQKPQDAAGTEETSEAESETPATAVTTMQEPTKPAPTQKAIDISKEIAEATEGLTKKLEFANQRLDDLKSPGNVLTGYDAMVSLLDSHNFNGKILNADKFTLDPDFIPIVVRVYNKDQYFGFALEKYRQVEGINKTMIIVSHDGLFPEIMAVVRSIDFCQVKQLIHPYSGHIMKNRFPGPDADVDKANFDQYKNPRPWNFAALKHHFWWHLNYVWDVVLPKHAGDMIFMEEDHVPMYDMLITAKALATIRKEKCPTCFNSKIHQHNHHGTDVHSAFVSTDLGNVGITFDRQSWLELKAAGENFCTFDDYNWDWTMTHLITIKKIRPHSLTATVPRAEHMGKCGTHAGAGGDQKSGACLINERDKQHIAEVNDMLRRSNGHDWSNPTVELNPSGSPAHHLNGWGGWTKPDHEHCKAQIKANPAWP